MRRPEPGQPAAAGDVDESRAAGAFGAAAFGGPIAVALWLAVVFAAVGVPLFIAPTDLDAFRTPKDLLFKAVATVCAALLGALLMFRPAEVLTMLRTHRAAVLVGAAAVLWTAITTLTSTNRTLSMQTLLWVALTYAFFLAALVAARRQWGLWMLSGLFTVAVINAALAVVQRTQLWNPLVFAFWIPARIRTTGLVGNPNDLGTYLLFPTIAAATLAIVSGTRRRRIVWGAVFVVLSAGIVATATLGAIIGYGASMLVLIAFRTRRIVASMAAVAVVAIILFVAVGPLRRRAVEFATFARQGQYVQLLSMRAPAFAAAVDMFKDHPLTGVGPGCYGYWYLPYKMKLHERFPSFYVSRGNFGETHNDHLQTLAVTGIPGYLIYLAAILLMARYSLLPRDRVVRASGPPSDPTPAPPEEPNERREFSRLFALPFAVAFAVVTLAQFPLELASATSVIMQFAAVCAAWSWE